jgi:hypothetical protein
MSVSSKVCASGMVFGRDLVVMAHPLVSSRRSRGSTAYQQPRRRSPKMHQWWAAALSLAEMVLLV